MPTCDPIIETLKSLLTELNSRISTLTPNPNPNPNPDDPRILTPHLTLINISLQTVNSALVPSMYSNTYLINLFL